jgi:hypothetical protein
VAAVAITAVVSLAFAPLAQAAAPNVTFATTSTGSRTVTAAVAPTFPVTTDLSVSSGTVATTVPATTTLTEVFSTGATWSVKAQMCAPDSYTSPAAADCTTNGANRIVRSGSGLAADMIPGSTISLTRGTPVVTGVPAGTATAGSETNLGSQITLLTSSDEVATTTYNGVYSVTTGLTISSLTKTGSWKGYWVITQTT